MSFYSSFAALELTQRTSTAAFSTITKAKIQQKEFAEALKLVNEWRMVDPEVRKNLNKYVIFSIVKLKPTLVTLANPVEYGQSNEPIKFIYKQLM